VDCPATARRAGSARTGVAVRDDDEDITDVRRPAEVDAAGKRIAATERDVNEAHPVRFSVDTPTAPSTV
jgi:hypothetical protein